MKIAVAGADGDPKGRFVHLFFFWMLQLVCGPKSTLGIMLAMPRNKWETKWKCPKNSDEHPMFSA